MQRYFCIYGWIGIVRSKIFFAKFSESADTTPPDKPASVRHCIIHTWDTYVESSAIGVLSNLLVSFEHRNIASFIVTSSI